MLAERIDFPRDVRVMRCDESEAIPDLAERDTPEILTLSEIPAVSCVHLDAFISETDGPDHLPDALCSDCARDLVHIHKEAYSKKTKHFVIAHTYELSYYCDSCYSPIARVKTAEECKNCRYVYARKLQGIIAAGHTLSSYPGSIIEPSEY